MRDRSVLLCFLSPSCGCFFLFDSSFSFLISYFHGFLSSLFFLFGAPTIFYGVLWLFRILTQTYFGSTLCSRIFFVVVSVFFTVVMSTLCSLLRGPIRSGNHKCSTFVTRTELRVSLDPRLLAVIPLPFLTPVNRPLLTVG